MILEFGVNKKFNLRAYKRFGLNIKANQIFLNNKQENLIRKGLKKKLFGKLLRQRIKNRIEFLIKNKTFKGIRHKNRYPARGQRTHTNGKTKRTIQTY
jgi:ribosomal protein S13